MAINELRNTGLNMGIPPQSLVDAALVRGFPHSSNRALFTCICNEIRPSIGAVAVALGVSEYIILIYLAANPLNVTHCCLKILKREVLKCLTTPAASVLHLS